MGKDDSEDLGKVMGGGQLIRLRFPVCERGMDLQMKLC